MFTAATPAPRPSARRLATLAGHRDAVYALAGSAAQPARVYSGGADGLVVAWDTADPARDGELLARVENSVYALRELPGSRLAVGHNFQGVQVLDVEAKKLLHATALPPLAIFDLAYSPSRQRLYAALADGTLAVLGGPDFRLLHLLRLSQKSLRTLALHEARAELAVGSSDHRAYVLDLDSLKVKNTLTEATNSVFAVAYAPDGQLLAAGRDAHLRRYDPVRGYALADIVVAHMYAINCLAFSADRRYQTSCSLDKSVKLWDARSLHLLRVLDRARSAGHGTSVNKVAWAGQRLVSASDDRTLGVWEVSEAAG